MFAGQTQVRGHVSGLAESARDGDAVEAAFAVVGSAWAFSLTYEESRGQSQGVKEFFATSDPEMDKGRREKQKDEEIRREARRKAREARGNYSGGGYGGRAAAGMNRAFLEDDEPGLYDDVGDVGALKRSTKAATNEAIFGESDEEEDDGRGLLILG